MSSSVRTGSSEPSTIHASSVVPGRQSAIGLTLLFIGPAVAYLFFYTPQKGDEETADSIYAQVRSKRIEDPLEALTAPPLPSSSPTRWSMSSTSTQGNNVPSGGMVRDGSDIDPHYPSQLDKGLDSLASGKFASQPVIPKEYSSQMEKPEGPSVILHDESVQANPSNALVPLKESSPRDADRNKDANRNMDANRSTGARFGAGAYRPKVTPSASPDRFPKPAPLLSNNLIKSSQDLGASAPLVPVGSASPVVASGMQELPRTPMGHQPQATLATTHSGQIIQVNPIPAGQRSYPPAAPTLPPIDPNYQPKFVHQPKRER